LLVVNVDVAGIEERGSRARRCQVRLLRPAGAPTAQQVGDSRRGQVTAVVILRDAAPSQVASCVRAAVHGEGSISRKRLGVPLPSGEGKRSNGSESQLTNREYDVLRMLADGDSTREIAHRLSYSERTVKNIVRDLLVKLNGKTRAHAVALATRQGVI
jgi:DNA-binding CsgD family transcriptional regulator